MSTDPSRMVQPVADPVQWHEGMLLHPQHFQQAWLRQDALTHYHLSRIAPFHHGVRWLELDRGALAAGRLRILGLEAVMPDGLPVWMDGASGGLDLDLLPLKDRLREPMRVHLVVSAQRPGSARSDDDLARWRSHPGEELADENTGQGSEPVPRLRPNLRLRLADDLPPRSIDLPLAELEFRNQTFQVTAYEPPSAGWAPDNPVLRDCRALIAKLREKAVYVAESRGAEMNRAEARHTVMCLVAGLPQLEALLHLPSLHPFDLYMALQAVVGQTATLRPTMTPPLTEPYDHLDPRGCIGRLLVRLDDTVELVSQAFSALPFQAAPNGFRLRIESEWAAKDLVVAVRPKPGQRADDVADWMAAALVTVEDRLEELIAYRLSGAGRIPLTGEEADAYAGGRELLLYRIEVGEFVKGDAPLLIVNPLDRSGVQRPAEILLFVPTPSKPAER